MASRLPAHVALGGSDAPAPEPPVSHSHSHSQPQRRARRPRSRPLLHAVILDHDAVTRAYAVAVQFAAVARGIDVFLHTEPPSANPTAPPTPSTIPATVAAALPHAHSIFPLIQRSSPAHLVVGISAICASSRTVLAAPSASAPAPVPLPLHAACDVALREWWRRADPLDRLALVHNPNIVPATHIDAILEVYAPRIRIGIRTAIGVLSRTADAVAQPLNSSRQSLVAETATKVASHFLSLGTLDSAAQERVKLADDYIGTTALEAAPSKYTLKEGEQTNTGSPHLSGFLSGPAHSLPTSFTVSSNESCVPQDRDDSRDIALAAIDTGAPLANLAVRALKSGLDALQNLRSDAFRGSIDENDKPSNSFLRCGPASSWLRRSNDLQARVIRAQLLARTMHIDLLAAYAVIVKLPVRDGHGNVGVDSTIDLETCLPSEIHRQLLLRELNHLLPRIEELGARLSKRFFLEPRYSANACLHAAQRRPRLSVRITTIGSPWLSYAASLESRSNDRTTDHPHVDGIAGVVGRGREILANGGWLCVSCSATNRASTASCTSCQNIAASLSEKACASLTRCAQLQGVTFNMASSVSTEVGSHISPWISLPSLPSLVISAGPDSALTSASPMDDPSIPPPSVSSSRDHVSRIRYSSVMRAASFGENIGRRFDSCDRPAPEVASGSTTRFHGAQGCSEQFVEPVLQNTRLVRPPTRTYVGNPRIEVQSQDAPASLPGRTFAESHHQLFAPPTSSMTSSGLRLSPSLPVPIPNSTGIKSLTSQSSNEGEFVRSRGSDGSLGPNVGGRIAYSPEQTVFNMEQLSIGSVEARDFVLSQRAGSRLPYTSSQPMAIPGTSASSGSRSPEHSNGQSSLHALAAASDAANGGAGSATVESLAAVSAAMFSADRADVDSASVGTGGSASVGVENEQISNLRGRDGGTDTTSTDAADRRYAMF
jgi:hypothetical protein